MDATNIVQFHKNWSAYKTRDFSDLPPQLVYPRTAGKFLGDLRDWLSRKSVLYTLVTQRRMFNFVREREIPDGYEGSDTRIDYHDANRHEVFYLNSHFRMLDSIDPRIKAGLEITEHAMIDMSNDVKRNAIRLIVALIGTKGRTLKTAFTQSGSKADS